MSSEAPRDSSEPTSTPAIRIRLHQWLARAPGGRSIFRLLLAAVLGVGAAYGALLFRGLIALVQQQLFPGGTDLDSLHATSWMGIIIPPAIGGLIVAPLVHYLAPEAKGHGVPEVKDACANRGGRMRGRVVVIKTLASALTIGSGGSVGREGPIVQIGSALGSKLAQLTGLRGQYLIDFTAAGAAAGIAATFNAPIAGVMFAIEIIMGRGSPRHFGPLVVASVIATVIVHHYVGANPAFVVPAYTLVSAWELPLYVLLGGLAGVVGVFFTRTLYLVEDAWAALPLPEPSHGVLGGLMVGMIALFFPEVFGVGYELIESALGVSSTPMPLTSLAVEANLLVLIVAKIAATSITIGSGGSGGIFAPSLFMGTCLGGAVGGLAKHWAPPGKIANPSAYALVGQAALVGATTHAPLTAIVIVFELCNRHSIILPLMLATILSTTVAMALLSESIYTMKLVRRGTGGSGGSRAQLLHHLPVGELMRVRPARVRENAPIDAIVERARQAASHYVYVADNKRHLLGVISMDDVAAHIDDSPTQRRALHARDLMHAAEAVTVDHGLEECRQLLENRRREELPVIDREKRLIGRVTRGDILTHVSREVLRRDADLELVSTRPERQTHELIALETGEVKGTVDVGGPLVGKSLRELDLRARFGVSVYAIRTANEQARLPDPGAALTAGDVLVVFGEEKQVEALRRFATGS